MIKYYKLFDLLNRRGMKKTDLLTIISTKTLAKLSKGEVVKTDIISKICVFLECQPADIMEEVSQERNITADFITYQTHETNTIYTDTAISHDKSILIDTVNTQIRDKETGELILNNAEIK